MVLPRLTNFALGLLAVINLIVIATATSVTFRHTRDFDFNVFWTAGGFANQGEALTVWTERIFFHPPPFLLLVQPLALVPLPIGVTLWIGLTLAALIFAARRIAGLTPAAIIAFPPIMICGIIGQTGFLIAALFIGAARCMASRPMLAGALLGALVIKPQMGLLVPIALIAGREWKAFIGATIAVVALFAAAALAYGIDAYAVWFGMLGSPTAILTTGSVGWEKMSSVYATLRMQGVGDTAAWTAHGVVATAATLAVVRTWLTNSDPLARFSVLACATALTSPYFFVYDLVFLILPVAWCARQARHRWIAIAAAASLLPAVLLNWLPNAFPNPAPLVAIVLLALSVATSEAIRPLSARPREPLHRRDRQTA